MFCFIIMPYGGQDEEKRKHYLGIYNQILKAAAIEAGFTPANVKRSDIAALPGSVLHDIVKDLNESDIVIADLTEGNPNVFWELGVRQVLRKCGTVTVIDEDYVIPFDLGQYRTIKYSTKNLGSISAVVSDIANSIRKRLEAPEKPDNAVHDIIPELPIHFSSGNTNSEILLLKDRINELSQENATLSAKLKMIDPGGTLNDESFDAVKMFEQATEIYKSTGAKLTLHLATAKEQGEERFLNELKIAVQNPYLSISDFLQIRKLCNEMGLIDHQRAVLEIAAKRFPYDSNIKLALVDSYDDAESPILQERGRLMIEEYLGVNHLETGPVITNRINASKTAIGLLFNFYFTARRFEWVISAANSLENLMQPTALVVRNKARALARLGIFDEAEKEFIRAVELDNKDDTTYLVFGDFLDDMGRYEDAYKMVEKAICSDPEDGSRYIALGNQILMRGFARDDNGAIFSGLKKDERLEYALPLLIHGIRVSPNPSLINKVAQVLVGANALKEAEAILNGSQPTGKYVPSSLEYVLNLIIKQGE